MTHKSATCPPLPAVICHLQTPSGQGYGTAFPPTLTSVTIRTMARGGQALG